MAILKSFPWLRERVRIHLTEWGYDVQVYGQTVMRATDYREATRFAAGLRRELSKKPAVLAKGQITLKWAPAEPGVTTSGEGSAEERQRSEVLRSSE